jgi:hypothetical protein
LFSRADVQSVTDGPAVGWSGNQVTFVMFQRFSSENADDLADLSQ